MKEFFDAAARSTRHDLFIVPTAGAREALVVELFNEAGERGLCPIYRSPNSTMYVGANSRAVLRIAHERLADQHAGMIWSKIHGLDALDAYDNAEEQKLRLRAFVRPEVYG